MTMHTLVPFILWIVVLGLVVSAQEPDILDSAEKNPRYSQVQNPDGTWRTPKYGDHALEKAVDKLEGYARPFTAVIVISWYLKSKDPKIRASLLRVLAASRDPRAAVVLGNSLKDDALDVRMAATYALMDYFSSPIVDGGTEQHMLTVQAWWKNNRERLEQEAKCVTAEPKKIPSCHPTRPK